MYPNKTPTYRAWQHMRSRCFRPTNKDYRHYGGRGITVCQRWAQFENFAQDMGERPANMTLERIDHNGNYTPTNCRWATQKEQTRNTRANRLITYAGVTKPLAVWCEELGLNYDSVHHRLRRNWPIEHAFSTCSYTSRHARERVFKLH